MNIYSIHPNEPVEIIMKEYINNWSFLYTNHSRKSVMCTYPNRDMKGTLYPTVDELISRLKDPEYLNYDYYGGCTKERYLYLIELTKRPDITEIQKRLIKMYQSKIHIK